MTTRTARVLLMSAAFLAGLVMCFGIVLLMSGRGTAPIIQQAAAIGGPFSLIDQNGKTVTDKDVQGKPFLVFFGFTHCPEICPTTLFEVSEVFRRLGSDADRARALFISVDPERDTPSVMKDYLSSFDSHLVGLTGGAEDIAAVAKAYRAPYRKVPLADGGYTMDHLAIVYMMDKSGRFVAPFSLRRTADAAAEDLRKQL